MGTGTSSGKGRVYLPPISDSIMGAPRNFYETMNSNEARGPNKVQFTSGIKDDPFIHSNWAQQYVEGTYEIASTDGGIQRRSGIITTVGKDRLIGIEKVYEGSYNVTDIRTGMLVAAGMSSISQATYRAGVLVDGTVKASTLNNAEDAFKKKYG